MQIERYHVVVSFTPSRVKALAGYVLKGKPVVLNMVEVMLEDLLVDGKIKDAAKATYCVKDALDQIAKSLNGIIGSVGVITPAFSPEIRPVHVESATVGQTITKTDVKNCVSLIKKNVKIEERGALLDVVPFGFELDDKEGLSLGLPYGKAAEKINLYASKIFEQTSLTNEFREAVKKAGYAVGFSNLSPYAIGTYFEKNLLGKEEGLILSLEEKQSSYAFVRQGVLMNVGQAQFGYGEAFADLSKKFSMAYSDAMKDAFLFGLVGHDPAGFKSEEGIDLEEFRKEAVASFDSYLDKVLQFLYRGFESLPDVLLVGSGSLLQGFPQLVANHLEASLSVGKVSSFGARERRYGDVLGGLLLAEMHSFLGQTDSQTRLLERTTESLNRGY